jgi:transcription termination/antitermination protein NusG
MNKRRWYVLYLRSRYEKRVHEELEKRGIESFLPLVTVVRQWSDRKKKVEMPLFPGYDFVRIELTEKIRVLEVDGVVKFVAIGSAHPEAVPDKQIESLKLVIASPKTLRKENPMKGGEIVKVKSGPFAGAQGIVVRAKNSARVVISIESIQQAVSVEVPVEHLEPIGLKSEEPRVKQEGVGG